MAHIDLPKELPGIRGPMAFRPDTAKPLNELAEVLLRSDNSLTRGEREIIATHVSYLNDCFFCQNAHGGLAQRYQECTLEQMDAIKINPDQAPISAKLKALLSIAGSVQKSGKHVTPEQVEKAKKPGRYRHRNTRHRIDCRRLLHVQPLCGRLRHLGTTRQNVLRESRKDKSRRRLRQLRSTSLTR